MIEAMKTSPKLLVSALGLAISPWILAEATLGEDSALIAVRWATLIGLGSFPLLIAVYWSGFRGEVVDSIRSIAYSFAAKFVILAGASLLMHVYFGVDVLIFTSLLFFLLFSLTFFAIYLARRAANPGGH